MGGAVHTIVAPIERAKLLLQALWEAGGSAGGNSREWSIAFPALSGKKAFSRFGEAMAPAFFAISPSVALNFSLKDLYRNILRSGNNQDGHFLSGVSVNFIAGAAAGCTTLILIYPLDITHTRLAADIGRTDVRQFQSTCHFLTTICKKDGIGGVYRGLPASLQGMVVHWSLYFGGFDTMKEILSEEAKPELALWKRWLVAQSGTTSAGLFSYPLDTVRRRMMMQSGLEQPMYRSTLDCWRKIYRSEGVTSFYCGAMSNMFRSTGAAAIFVLFDEVKKFMKCGGP